MPHAISFAWHALTHEGQPDTPRLIRIVALVGTPHFDRDLYNACAVCAEGDALRGRIELPLQVGWVGGAVNSHPGIRTLRRISGVSNSRELASLLASVGLAQNFAACLALGTVGIQKGHMALHARQIAIAAGATGEQVEMVVRKLIAGHPVSLERAQEILREL